MNKNILLIIDPQYDFTSPDGALYVPNAEKDMERLSNWISDNSKEIDSIIVTLDTHQLNDIAHPGFWKDANGKNPSPFTLISLNDVKEGKWIPNFEKEWTLKYLETLEKQGEFSHFIWPVHCLAGTKGSNVDETLMSSIISWSKEGKMYHMVNKGFNPLTEQFGIFKSQVIIASDPDTHFNTSLVSQLNEYENIFVSGEAKSHCVATSIKQLMDEFPLVAKKITILEDTMSDVPNFGHLGDPIYKQARELGIKFLKTTDIVLSAVEIQ